MKTTVELKNYVQHGAVLGRDRAGGPIIGTRGCILLIGGVEFEAHPSEDTQSCQQTNHINEIARRFVAEYNKP